MKKVLFCFFVFYLSEVTWPRRANGSMDYPPPEGVRLTALTDYSEVAPVDTSSADYKDATELIEKTVVQEPGTALPLIIALAAAGVLLAAVVAVFLVRQKKRR